MPTIPKKPKTSQETRRDVAMVSPPYACAQGAPHDCPPEDWGVVYLNELEIHGQMAKAADAAGRTLRTVQRRRKTDPVFAAAENDALEVASDLVRSEITRRAVEGVETRTVTRDGREIIRTEYSDTLILRLAEYLECGSWRQRQQVEHGAPGAFKTHADLKAAIAKRQEELAKAKAAMAADSAASAAAAHSAQTPHVLVD